MKTRRMTKADKERALHTNSSQGCCEATEKGYTCDHSATYWTGKRFVCGKHRPKAEKPRWQDSKPDPRGRGWGQGRTGFHPWLP
jgi:hypothetical protein